MKEMKPKNHVQRNASLRNEYPARPEPPHQKKKKKTHHIQFPTSPMYEHMYVLGLKTKP